MGGRGSFINVDTNNFAFKDGGQTYFEIGTMDDEIKILERHGLSIKAPEISHSANRIYAIVQNKELKHLAFYNYEHKQIRCIDFGHEHGWKHIKPHVHFNLDHDKNEPGTKPNLEDMIIANKVNEWLKNKYK